MPSDIFSGLKFEPVSPKRDESATGHTCAKVGRGMGACERVNTDVGAGVDVLTGDSTQGVAGTVPSFTANGQPRASRAAQFMPFAALTGYYELARQQERIVEPRHELTDEEALALSRTIMQVKRGDLVRVTYYDWDAYRTVTGVVARIDTTFRRLQVIKTVIPFDDILSLERNATRHPGVH